MARRFCHILPNYAATSIMTSYIPHLRPNLPYSKRFQSLVNYTLACYGRQIEISPRDAVIHAKFVSRKTVSRKIGLQNGPPLRTIVIFWFQFCSSQNIYIRAVGTRPPTRLSKQLTPSGLNGDSRTTGSTYNLRKE